MRYSAAVRAEVLETMVLGMLADGPTHGYDLRRRLAIILGPLRTLSFGSLYPGLKRLAGNGEIERVSTSSTTRRSTAVYAITEQGQQRLSTWLQGNSPADWDDEGFLIRLAFFSRTDARIRLHVLQGRRTRLEERLAALGESLEVSRKQVDTYVELLQRHSVEGTKREMTWIDELIRAEQRGARTMKRGRTT
jgi:DNA-binding PadR family transcriptional regulator